LEESKQGDVGEAIIFASLSTLEKAPTTPTFRIIGETRTQWNRRLL